MIEFIKIAKKILNDYVNVKRGESVLVITDTSYPKGVADALLAVGHSEEIDVNVIVIGPKALRSPSDSLMSAIKGFNVIIQITSTGFGGSLTQLLGKGTRVLCLAQVSAEQLVRSLGVDKDKLIADVTYFSDKLIKGSKMRITTVMGSDLSLNLGSRKVMIEDGVVNKGEWDTFPGVVYTTLEESSAKGTVVVDTSMGWFPIGGTLTNRMIHTPVTLKITGGKVVDVLGQIGAAIYKKILSNGGENADVIAEVGVGLNANNIASGNILIDEGLYGAAHLGIGHNVHLGGKNKASQHIDIIFRDATFEIDGNIIMNKGVLLK